MEHKLYINSVSMKHTHSGRLRDLWVRRELGESLYKDCCTAGKLLYVESNSTLLPSDTYKTVDVYLKFKCAKDKFWFQLKHSF